MSDTSTMPPGMPPDLAAVLLAARRILASVRGEAPEGYDPAEDAVLLAIDILGDHANE